MKYYKGILGVVGVFPKHKKGKFTYLPGHNDPWIRTCDLYSTFDEASKSSLALFSNDFKIKKDKNKKIKQIF